MDKIPDSTVAKKSNTMKQKPCANCGKLIGYGKTVCNKQCHTELSKRRQYLSERAKELTQNIKEHREMYRVVRRQPYTQAIVITEGELSDHPEVYGEYTILGEAETREEAEKKAGEHNALLNEIVRNGVIKIESIRDKATKTLRLLQSKMEFYDSPEDGTETIYGITLAKFREALDEQEAELIEKLENTGRSATELNKY